MSISIEVVYALQLRQLRVRLDLPADSTVFDAVQASGLLNRLPQGQLGRVGVWGKLALPDARLRDGDRVEIHRPLIADPKEVRRDRAAKK